MARFYVRFDTKSQADLDTDYFDRRPNVGGSSASGAQYRDGLIASRSLISADIYDDLDAVNEDGSKGTYFPPDSGPFSTDSSTFVSWSTAYTSSINGIVTPSSNTYAQLSAVNYSLRPTASVLSTNPGVGATTPRDPVKAAYSTYISASRAVSASLAAITNGGPFSRLGNNSSRTVHSIWHDPDLTYFAWDDFTPGTPQPTGAANDADDRQSAVTGFTWTGSVFISMSPEFKNDFNQQGSASIVADLLYMSASGVPYAASFMGGQPQPKAATLNVTVPISSLVDVGAGGNIKAYEWTNIRLKTSSMLGPDLDQASSAASLFVSISFEDPILKGSQSPSFRTFSALSGSTGFVTVGGFTTNIACLIDIGNQ